MPPVIAFLWPKADFRATGLGIPDGFDVRFAPGTVRTEVEAASRGADYLVAGAGFTAVDRALLDLAPGVRLVQLTGAGTDNVDHAECARRGVPVCNVPGLNAPSVAQLVVQLALRCRRPLPLLSDGGAAEWNAARARHAASGHELAGIVGVVGYGNIGRAVAAMFRGFGLEVVRAERAGQEDAAVPALPLDELLARADIVVVCLPARADTRGLFDANRIARMKPGATLIHVGRGGVVDDAAVAAAIAEGRLAGAGFDVFETEPPPPDHPFLTLAPEARARLVLTPHIGGQTLESKARNFAVSLDNVQRVARGEAPLYRVPAGPSGQ